MEETNISCCGKKMKALLPQKADFEHALLVERIENDFYITTEHPMEKEHYISFVALLTSDTVLMKKLYPEWDVQIRLPRFAHGRLVWHCNNHGLFYADKY